MIKYKEYIASMLNKKLLYGWTYNDLSKRCGNTTRQNIHQILTMKAMGSLDSYRRLDIVFGNENTFEDYRKQFKGLLIGITNKEIAKEVGMKSEKGLENILECRHVGQYDNYMELEAYCERLEMETRMQLEELGVGFGGSSR